MLRQFFLQGGQIETVNGTALTLAAFAEYECAKNEAALPLNSDIFEEINPTTTEKWEQLKRDLGITD